MPSLYDLPLWLIAAVCVFASVAFAIAGALTAPRLGWTLDVSVQSSFGDVENASVAEASAAGDLYRTLAGLKDSSRVQIQRDVATYIDLVIDKEWPATRKGLESDTTWRHADHLYAEIVAY